MHFATKLPVWRSNKKVVLVPILSSLPALEVVKTPVATNWHRDNFGFSVSVLAVMIRSPQTRLCPLELMINPVGSLKSLQLAPSASNLGPHSWWRHQMETFSALQAICAGNSPVPVNSPHKGQWRGALMFSLICVWINGWVNNREAGDLRRYRAQYDGKCTFECRQCDHLADSMLKSYLPIRFLGLYLLNGKCTTKFREVSKSREIRNV